LDILASARKSPWRLLFGALGFAILDAQICAGRSEGLRCRRIFKAKLDADVRSINPPIDFRSLCNPGSFSAQQIQLSSRRTNNRAIFLCHKMPSSRVTKRDRQKAARVSRCADLNSMTAPGQNRCEMKAAPGEGSLNRTAGFCPQGTPPPSRETRNSATHVKTSFGHGTGRLAGLAQHRNGPDREPFRPKASRVVSPLGSKPKQTVKLRVHPPEAFFIADG
jgi:hypothetical protein